jgi:hypothetical protein
MAKIKNAETDLKITLEKHMIEPLNCQVEKFSEKSDDNLMRFEPDCT